ncbi:hypothetical protein GW17_00044232 [Ensete ventricosum]|nr:hypothetical protein GW17_00044232 [Ensete ventricosum]
MQHQELDKLTRNHVLSTESVFLPLGHENSVMPMGLDDDLAPAFHSPTSATATASPSPSSTASAAAAAPSPTAAFSPTASSPASPSTTIAPAPETTAPTTWEQFTSQNQNNI